MGVSEEMDNEGKWQTDINDPEEDKHTSVGGGRASGR